MRRIDPDSRRFNVALWRLARGRPGPGGVAGELAIVTGLSPADVRDRIAVEGRDGAIEA